MRSDVCLHRNAALIAAAEDAGIPSQAQDAAGAAGRGGLLPTPLAALLTQAAAHTELPEGRVRFDPVPVYIGPAPGWKGPALGVRPTTGETEAQSAGAKSLPAENASTVSGTTEGDAAALAPASSKSKLKLARHSGKRIAGHKPAKSATEKLEKKDVSTN
jgi:hypothetical protein